MNIDLNKGYNTDNLELMASIPDCLLDIICIDPPYLYLKGQKLERAFDEKLFFSECKRILNKNGFLILFGRGASFYRWGAILSELGFNFKEEIIWDKSYCSSPLMAMSRVHETISIWCKGKAGINRVKVPYVEMKGHDISSIVTDIKRLKTTFNNTKSLDAVLEYLGNNCSWLNDDMKGLSTTVSSNIKGGDRSVAVIHAIENGMNEKSVIRTDFAKNSNFSRHRITNSEKSAGDGDRCVKVVNAITTGMNEKSIIKELRDHYKTIHPTQKPVRLLERLIALVKPKKDKVIAADFFAGSFSFAEACINMGVDWICSEIDAEYFNLGIERIENYSIQNTTPCRK